MLTEAFFERLQRNAYLFITFMKDIEFIVWSMAMLDVIELGSVSIEC